MHFNCLSNNPITDSYTYQIYKKSRVYVVNSKLHNKSIILTYLNADVPALKRFIKAQLNSDKVINSFTHTPV